MARQVMGTAQRGQGGSPPAATASRSARSSAAVKRAGVASPEGDGESGPVTGRVVRG